MDKSKLRYAILKQIDDGNADTKMYEVFEVSHEEWFKQIGFLDREGYITQPMYGDNSVYSFAFTELTEKGEKYLHDNSKWVKAYGLAKEVRDWIAFFK